MSDREPGSIGKSFPSSDSLQSGQVVLTQEQSHALFTKITWRLIPLLFLSYIIAYIDRINVGFAKLQLLEVFGVDPNVFGRIYGLGAGLFFIGYFLLESV